MKRQTADGDLALFTGRGGSRALDEGIAALGNKLKPQTARILNTPDEITLFLAALAVALQSSPTVN